MTPQDIQEQLQEDILSILEGFTVKEVMNSQDYEKMKDALCNAVIDNIKKLKNDNTRNTTNNS